MKKTGIEVDSFRRMNGYCLARTAHETGTP